MGGQLAHHVGRQAELLTGEHEHEHSHVLLEDHGVRAGGVVDREIARLQQRLAAILDEHACSRHLQARLVEALVADGDERLGALDHVLRRGHLVDVRVVEVDTAQASPERVGAHAGDVERHEGADDGLSVVPEIVRHGGVHPADGLGGKANVHVLPPCNSETPRPWGIDLVNGSIPLTTPPDCI